MNKKSNQRYQETKQKIEICFQELLEKKEIKDVTVSEICRMSNIHRTTFYGHYEDVYDLMQHMVQQAYQEMMSFFISDDDKMTMGDGLRNLFMYIRENQVFFRRFLEGYTDVTFQEEQTPELLVRASKDIMRTLNYKNNRELLYHQTFFSEGLKAVIRMWIAKGCQEAPNEMAEIIVREYGGGGVPPHSLCRNPLY